MTEGTVFSVSRDSYAVRTSDGVVNYPARGKFRIKGEPPVTGDRVKIENGCIMSVEERSSFLPRPPIANFDRIAIIVAAAEPKPSTIVIDKLIAVSEVKGIEPILVFNKSDLADIAGLKEIYDKAGFITVVTDGVTGTGVDELRQILLNHFTVFTGNSGVGKSTLLNCLMPSLSLETGEISKKLGRGRHTTRSCEMIELCENTYIADTPGFAAVDIAEYCTLYSEDIWQTFREFDRYTDKCRFRTSCSHTCEKGCEIVAAVERDEISRSRFDSYLTLYEQVKNNRPWNIKQNKR